jgi:hypothetical protein
VNVTEAVFTASLACVSRPGIPVASEEPPQGTPLFGAPCEKDERTRHGATGHTDSAEEVRDVPLVERRD